MTFFSIKCSIHAKQKRKQPKVKTQNNESTFSCVLTTAVPAAAAIWTTINNLMRKRKEYHIVLMEYNFYNNTPENKNDLIKN